MPNTLVGTRFWEIRDTITNRHISRIWEVTEEVDKDLFKCHLISDSRINSVNPEHYEKWTREQILVELKRTPLHEG